MYDRAARILTRPATNTAPTVGPGTYYSPTMPPAGMFIEVCMQGYNNDKLLH